MLTPMARLESIIRSALLAAIILATGATLAHSIDTACVTKCDSGMADCGHGTAARGVRSSYGCLPGFLCLLAGAVAGLASTSETGRTGRGVLQVLFLTV
mmetsp:Transcript_30208/g.86560  ORF Transcript_30208/g.86560 Transcript_30208/m.86560 type:complete len:99 (-) Transcript_30208:178-474(-)